MPTIYDLLRSLYGGCNMEGEMRQLALLMDQLAREYFAMEATDEDVQGVLAKICKSVVAHMASCGKQYSPDQCVKDFYNALLMSPPDNVFASLRRNLRRRRSQNQPSGIGIL